VALFRVRSAKMAFSDKEAATEAVYRSILASETGVTLRRVAHSGFSVSIMRTQSCTHPSQMKTFAPAINFITWD
jgi:hypothetical protein